MQYCQRWKTGANCSLIYRRECLYVLGIIDFLFFLFLRIEVCWTSSRTYRDYNLKSAFVLSQPPLMAVDGVVLCARNCDSPVLRSTARFVQSS
jgi:hypothetical protein